MTQVDSQFVDKIIHCSSQHVAFQAQNLVGDNQETYWKPNPRFELKSEIELNFKKKVYPTAVKIYEKKNPGCLVEISGRTDSQSPWILMWQKEINDEILKVSERVFSPDLLEQNSCWKVQDLKLSFKFTDDRVPEISNVELVGNEYMCHKMKMAEYLIQNPEFSDLKIKIVNGEEITTIPTHKVVFAQYSTIKLDKNEILVENISTNATQALLYYLYTGKLSCSTSFKLKDLLLSCYALEVNVLVNQLESILDFDEDCLEILNGNQTISKRHAKACDKYLHRNMNRIIQHERFVDLTEEKLIKLLRRTDISVNEYLLLKNILNRWVIKNGIKSLESYFSSSKILDYIRFSSIPDYQIQEITKKFPFLKKYSSQTDQEPRRKTIPFFQSEILSHPQSLELPQNSTPKLIFHSEYGFNKNDFEKKCLNVDKSFIIIQDQDNNIFGVSIPTNLKYIKDNFPTRGFHSHNLYMFNFDMKINNVVIQKQRIEMSSSCKLFKHPNITVNNGLNIGDVLIISDECKFVNLDGEKFQSKQYFQTNFKIKRMEVFSL